MVHAFEEHNAKRALQWHSRPLAEEETLAQLTAAVSRAADDPTLWPDSLTEVSATLGNAATLLTLQPARAEPPRCVAAVGIALNFVRSYEDNYHVHDPWRQRMLPHPPGIGFGYELVPRWDLLRTKFYREWMAPQDLLPDLSLVGLIHKLGTQSLATLAVFRRRGTRLLRLEDATLLRRLLPHLQQALHNTRRSCT